MKRTAWKLATLLLVCLTIGCQRQTPQTSQDSRTPQASKASQTQRTGQTPRKPHKVVYLDQSRSFRLFPDDLGSTRPLAREIVRQAFLQAARDELGLETRDAWLGDAMPTQGDNAPWNVIVVLQNPLTVKIVRGFSSDQAEYSSHDLRRSMWGKHGINYRSLTELEESLSRGEYVEGLKEAGYVGKANAWSEKTTVPEPVEKLLGEMNFLSQFRAVQELHRIAREQGESSALLGALSRGYANLGVMTEFYWHPAYKVFKARSLLYAQRMLARDGKSPVARWHRAYAAALAGIPNWAESDLKGAGEAWQAIDEKERPPQPVWVPLIEPYCRYQVSDLEQHVQDPQIGELAAMLRFLTVEKAGGQKWVVQTALQTLEAIPECYRVHDSLCEFAGVRTLHSATLQPITIVGKTLYSRLGDIPGLPDEARAVVQKQSNSGGLLNAIFGNAKSQLADEFKARGELVQALLKTGETSASTDNNKSDAGEQPASSVQAVPSMKTASDITEPSWATLGLLIRELSFKQVYRRAYFERHCICVPTDAWLALAAPLVASHPYKVYLDTLAWENDKIREAASQLATLDPAGIEKSAWRLFLALGKDNDAARLRFEKEMRGNVDFTLQDIVVMVRIFQLQKIPAIELANILLDISPDSPFGRALLVQNDWERIQKSADQWDKVSSPYPHLSGSFGNRYMGLGRWDDAERCFKAAIETVPGDPYYYQQLARVYKLRGQTDLWLKTLEEYLKQPDYALDHFKVKSEIAEHFMAQKEWEKALPYAEGAAESYSSWGLLCAARCHEGLQSWEKAEQFYKAASERYRGSSLRWYFFCCRTGEGDREAAGRLAREHVKNLANIPGDPNLFELTIFYLLEEDPRHALKTLQQSLAKNPNQYDSLWLALIADQLKDVKERTIALNRVRSLGMTTTSGTAAKPDWANGLADLITKDIEQGEKGEVDLDAADKISETLDGFKRSWFHYLLAQYLSLHGNSDAAHRYWKRCMGWTAMENNQRTLAGAALVKDNIKPAEYKALLQPDSAKDEKPKPTDPSL